MGCYVLCLLIWKIISFLWDVDNWFVVKAHIYSGVITALSAVISSCRQQQNRSSLPSMLAWQFENICAYTTVLAWDHSTVNNVRRYTPGQSWKVLPTHPRIGTIGFGYSKLHSPAIICSLHPPASPSRTPCPYKACPFLPILSAFVQVSPSQTVVGNGPQSNVRCNFEKW